MTTTKSGNERLIEALEPIAGAIAALDLTDGAAAAATLEGRFPLDGEVVQTILSLCRRGLEEGWLCDRQAGPARFSRISKPAEQTAGLSIDAVLSSGAGLEHTHPDGEVDLCLTIDGEPKFDGHGAGWAVYPPGTRHHPDVEGGTMLLIYFLPGGKIEWHR